MLLSLLLLAPVAGVAARPCSDAAQQAGWEEPQITAANGERVDMAALTARLAERRVVFVAELHDRFDHHLNQLEIICRLARRGPLAVGLEFFQTPAQGALDAYVYGHGNLDRLLRESEWFDRWGYDPRLYAPILRFAREQRIPLVALNVPGELVRRVAREGLDGLSASERARLPQSIDQGSAAYRKRLRRVYERHPQGNARQFERFLQAQLIWDEGMAQRGAEYLLDHPGRRMVVLAGQGHVAYRDPIPARLARRVPVSSAVVLQSHEQDFASAAAGDFNLQSTQRPLAPAGMLGVRVEATTEAVRIEGFSDDSAARDAGLRVGDVVTAVDDAPIMRFADLRLALWRKRPGEPVSVSVIRAGVAHDVVLALH